MADEVEVINSIQSNIKNKTGDLTKYSLFLGGLDVSNASLAQYDPLRTGYARVFFVRKPKFLAELFAQSSENNKAKFKNFWHTLEYGFVSVDGIQNTTLETEQMTGGYAGRSFELPTMSKDETNAITLKVYESAGSPIREMIDLWVTGMSDPHTGLTHYHGMLDGEKAIPLSQANHTAEMIYVVTDPTGKSTGIEYACMLANMMPKTVKKDHFNYESGSHPIVQYDIEFTATKYESVQINEVAQALLARQTILRNYTYFKSSYTASSEEVANSTQVLSTSWGDVPKVDKDGNVVANASGAATYNPAKTS
jgi:hypothetical protein